jgi:hypothetical protein
MLRRLFLFTYPNRILVMIPPGLMFHKAGFFCAAIMNEWFFSLVQPSFDRCV